MILILAFLLVATSPEAVAFALSGFLAPYLTHLTKNYFGVDSLWAYTLHVAFAVALSALSLFATGGLTLTNLVNSTGVLFMMTQTVFQLMKQSSGLKVEPVKIDNDGTRKENL